MILMGGFTLRRFRIFAQTQSVLSLYMTQLNSPLTHLKKENFGQNLKILTHKEVPGKTFTS